MSQEIQAVPQQPRELAQWKSTSAMKARVQAIQQLMADVLKPASKESGWDGDYGVIPGTGNKPSLLKSGSEQILAMFEIAVDPVVEDLSTEDCRRYRVICRLIHAPNGNFIGAGVGEASTDETKYKWKQTYSKAEYESTPADRRRIKYSQYKNNNGMYEDKEVMQIRQEPADLANTVLKMAKKRAQIDATLTVTGASSMFVQDLEEETVQDAQQERPKGTRGKKAAPVASKVEDVKCASCGAINGHLPSCKYHPSNVGKASSTGRPAQTIQNSPATEAAKQEAKAETETKNVKPTNRGTATVNEIISKKSSKGADFLELQCVDAQGHQGVLFVWHKHLHEYLLKAKGMECEFDLSKNTVKDKTYFSVEHVHRIGSVKFVDDKPVAQPSAEELGFGPPDDDGPEDFDALPQD